MQLLKLLTICLNRIFALQKISNLFSFRKNFLICGKKKKKEDIFQWHKFYAQHFFLKKAV